MQVRDLHHVRHTPLSHGVTRPLGTYLVDRVWLLVGSSPCYLRHSVRLIPTSSPVCLLRQRDRIETWDLAVRLCTLPTLELLKEHACRHSTCVARLPYGLTSSPPPTGGRNRRLERLGPTTMNLPGENVWVKLIIELLTYQPDATTHGT